MVSAPMFDIIYMRLKCYSSARTYRMQLEVSRCTVHIRSALRMQLGRCHQQTNKAILNEEVLVTMTA